jgi:uncharacterized protein YndB with AHSA1/START domain
MKKTKIRIEYQLSNASLSILWNSIGTQYGLSEWFADEVTVEDEIFTFRWDDWKQHARLLHLRQNSHIRFQWEEDKDTEAYFEIKVVSSELSKDLMLQITDFASPEESDEIVLLWNKSIEKLRRLTGM